MVAEPNAPVQEENVKSRTQLVELPKVSEELDEIDLVKENGTEFSPDKIYDQYTPKFRYLTLLLLSSTTFMLPVTDTAYLPSLPDLQADFKTTSALVSLSFSIFTVFMGISPLFWGPIADYFGRKVVICSSLLIYLGATIGCIFPKDIAVFLVLRVLQAVGCSSLIVVGISVVTDIFPPHQRGRALGYFGVPLLFGPVLGPVIGGALAFQWSWRAVFVFLAILGGLFLLLQAVVLRETLPYFAFEKRFAKTHQIANPYPKPIFQTPWRGFVYLKYPTILNLAVASGFSMGTMFNMMANILPVAFADDYELSTLISGLAFLPFGVFCIIGSILGGNFSDKIIAKTKLLESQLIGTVFGYSVAIIGALTLGWTANEKKGGLPVLLIFSALVGFGNAFGGIGSMGYPPSIKPKSAGKIVGVTQSVTWIIAGVTVIIGEQIVRHKNGYGWMMLFVAGLLFCSLIPITFLIARKFKNRPPDGQPDAPQVRVVH
eukprot:TRINITY_DN24937_c0_g1_i1.p1 TRINITY_DN24937_c0_g1~~TRINITY_DN24937_c0_g1_i1.p1  ORF type:complete len:488 (-),score=48.67 TRINITY_DN24937_c0_g1_i1:86-1549(-)